MEAGLFRDKIILVLPLWFTHEVSIKSLNWRLNITPVWESKTVLQLKMNILKEGGEGLGNFRGTWH